MDKNIKEQIENEIGHPINKIRPLTGGSIGQTCLIESKQNRYVLKYNEKSSQMFILEAAGLLELAKAGAIATPEVVQSNEYFILMEYIPSENPSSIAMSNLAKGLAKMHRFTSGKFGLFTDNFIGSTKQLNSQKNNWPDFFWTNRLKYQLDLANQKGFELHNIVQLELHCRELLKNTKATPSLIHGDLWSGNYLIGPNATPYLIDPAVYYADREAEFGMTYLFGGFGTTFYEAYQQEFPFEDGWQTRLPLYKLYHVLNHVNLFGRSYLPQAKQLFAEIIQ